MQRSRIKHYLVFITIVFFYLDSTKLLSEETNDNELQKIQTFQSESFSTRIRFVVIHYTSIDWENSLKVLTSERYEVSSHYLIPENGDDTYSDQIGWTSLEENFEDYEDPTPKEPEIITHQCTMCGVMMRIPRPKRERYKVICAHPECGHADMIGI